MAGFLWACEECFKLFEEYRVLLANGASSV